MKNIIFVLFFIVGFSASGKECLRDGVKFDREDGKACGIFGCAKNEDGTFTPRLLPCACEPGGCKRAGLNEQVKSDYCINPDVKLKQEDGKACGIFGCHKNADGTYSPIMLCKVPVSKSDRQRIIKRIEPIETYNKSSEETSNTGTK